MNKYDVCYNSIQKNIQELCEFLVDDCKVSGYYDLVDYMIELINFKAIMYQENKELTQKVWERVLDEQER